MRVTQKIGKEISYLTPVLGPMGIVGTIIAYVLSQNIFMSIAAAFCPIAGFVLYFCASPFIAVRSLKLTVAVTASTGLAILFNIPFKIFVLTSLFIMMVTPHLTRKMYRSSPLREPRHPVPISNLELLAQRRLENLAFQQGNHEIRVVWQNNL